MRIHANQFNKAAFVLTCVASAAQTLSKAKDFQTLTRLQDEVLVKQFTRYVHVSSLVVESQFRVVDDFHAYAGATFQLLVRGGAQAAAHLQKI